MLVFLQYGSVLIGAMRRFALSSDSKSSSSDARSGDEKDEKDDELEELQESFAEKITRGLRVRAPSCASYFQCNGIASFWIEFSCTGLPTFHSS